VGVGEVEVPYKVGQVESRWSPAEFATAGTDMKQFGESDLSNLELPGCVLLDKFPDCTPSLLQTSSVSNPGRNLTDPDPDPDPDLTLEFGKAGPRPRGDQAGSIHSWAGKVDATGRSEGLDSISFNFSGASPDLWGKNGQAR
jgi:hypothetical protein